MEAEKSKAVFHGIHVYEISENGNLLNGIYTNTDSHYFIDNEVAERKFKEGENINIDGELEGDYECRYIQHTTTDMEVFRGDLKIERVGEVYEFTWSGTAVSYTGIGFKVGRNHIAVSYTKI